MLELRNVSKYYFTGSQVVQALRRISFVVNAGELLCITGASGSGKTTLLNIIGGLDTYEEGALFVDGKDFSHYTTSEMERYRKEHIGFVFQDFQIIEHFSVYQNVEVALSVFAMSKQEKRRRVLELLDQVGLTSLAKRKASTLSGGEKQRTVLARTLAKDSPIIVCDEPTGNLNEAAAKEIFALLATIAKERMVIVVTHDQRMVDAYATRRIRLHDGEIIEDQRLSNRPLPEGMMGRQVIQRTRLAQLLAIAWSNLVTMPKLTVFTWMLLFILLSGVLLTFGIGVIERNRSVPVDNPYFTHASPTRIIVTRRDGNPLTDADRSLIETARNVRGILDCDAVFDSTFLYKTTDPATQQTVFMTFLPAAAAALDESDLLEGRFPTGPGEALVGEEAMLPVGKDIDIANAYQLSVTQELQTDQYAFRIVGIVREETTFDEVYALYVNPEGWMELAKSTMQERSEIELRIEGTRVFDLSLDSWVVEDGTEEARKDYVLTVPVWISEEAGLQDDEILVHDMFFFDICRDFGYKKEIRDDMEAGLCTAEEFVQSHQLSLRTNHMFSDNLTFSPVILKSSPQTDDDRSFKFFMNAATFDKYFGRSSVQSSVIVKNAYDAKEAAADLIEMGFDVMVPSQVLSEWTALEVLIRNVLVTLIVLAICLALMAVGWVVSKNVGNARRGDYLILRSLGVERRGMRRLIGIEWGILFLLAAVALFVLSWILSSRIPYVRLIFDYLRWFDYLGTVGLFLFFFTLLSRLWSRDIFQTSVMKAIKGVKR